MLTGTGFARMSRTGEVSWTYGQSSSSWAAGGVRRTDPALGPDRRRTRLAGRRARGTDGGRDRPRSRTGLLDLDALGGCRRSRRHNRTPAPARRARPHQAREFVPRRTGGSSPIELEGKGRSWSRPGAWSNSRISPLLRPPTPGAAGAERERRQVRITLDRADGRDQAVDIDSDRGRIVTIFVLLAGCPAALWWS